MSQNNNNPRPGKPGGGQPQKGGQQGQGDRRGNNQHHQNHRDQGHHRPHHGDRAPAAAPLTEITAPYNFVPLNNQIVQPEWASQVSHDWPFSDGLSGSLDVTITAETPVLVGAEKEGGSVTPFQLPSGQYALPGSALRGMIRNMLEIATFGRMGKVDDRKYGVRDLQNRPLYGKHMTDTVGQNVFKAKSKSGWLRFSESIHYIVFRVPALTRHNRKTGV